MNWYIEVLKKYAVFNGRARRKEYWFFVLFNLIVSIALAFVDRMVGTFDSANGFGILSLIYALAVLLPAIGVTIRRLHDSNRSGWWILISFVPFIGAIVLLIFMLLDSTAGSNRFGENPKEEMA